MSLECWEWVESAPSQAERLSAWIRARGSFHTETIASTQREKDSRQAEPQKQDAGNGGCPTTQQEVAQSRTSEGDFGGEVSPDRTPSPHSWRLAREPNQTQTHCVEHIPQAGSDEHSLRMPFPPGALDRAPQLPSPSPLRTGRAERFFISSCTSRRRSFLPVTAD